MPVVEEPSLLGETVFLVTDNGDYTLEFPWLATREGAEFMDSVYKPRAIMCSTAVFEKIAKTTGLKAKPRWVPRNIGE